ncbi:MAG: flavodoxin domain-containing protein [Candidatus Caldatribacteriota bacterium]|nr:flavodoxin domain-containing protein [Atribacterota bacterium]
MKVLIVYYSRTGKTENIARQIGVKINAELQEIKDYKKRNGIIGFITSGNEAHLKKTIEIKDMEKEPDNYEIVIIGTPIWANNISTPIRSFLGKHHPMLKEKEVAFYCTSLGSDPKPVFKEMENMIIKKPITVMNITARDIKNQYHVEMVDNFVKEIKKHGKQ